QVKRPKGAATAIVDGATIFASLEGIIDFAKEAERFEKEIRKLTDELIGLSNKLNNDDFLKKAPAHVVDRVKGKQKILLEKEQKLRTNLSRIKEAQA
ncbi:MAG: valine--tRNA ligase, partial [Desulfobacterales bacterium]